MNQFIGTDGNHIAVADNSPIAEGSYSQEFKSNCATSKHETPDLKNTNTITNPIDTDPHLSTLDVSFLQSSPNPGCLGTLGHYEVIDVIGQGGMGMVFRAVDTKLDRVVALKVMKPRLATNADACRRFKQEAQAMAALEHDHIISIHQVDEDQGVPFFATPLLEGMSLRAYLQHVDRLDLRQGLRIARQIALGLAASHENGLIHRDIKPGNIWLEQKANSDEPIRVKILDFGLVRSISNDAHVTENGVVVGTPAYMAPEQAQAKPVDHRSDLFSLGCVVYHMFTGSVPFQGTDTMSILMSLATHKPPSLTQTNAEVPQPLSELVDTMLAKDAAQRPASAMVVADTLADIETNLTYQETARGLPIRRWNKRWLSVAVLAATCLAFVLLYTLAQTFFLRTEGGTIRIEVNDPKTKLTIAGNVYTFRHKGKNITMTPGRKTLTIARDGFEFETRNFVLREGKNTVLRIDFHDGHVQIVQDGKVLRKELIPNPRPRAPVISQETIQPATWDRGPLFDILPGLIPRPANLPKFKRWQVTAESSAYQICPPAWSPDGRWVACLVDSLQFDSAELRLYEAQTMKLTRILSAGESAKGIWQSRLLWSPNSRWICVNGKETTRLFRPDGTVGPTFAVNWSWAFAWHPNSKSMMAWYVHKRTGPDFYLLDVDTGKSRTVSAHPGGIRMAKWRPDGKFLATGGRDKTVKLWSSDANAKPVVLKHPTGVEYLDWHPSEDLLATCCEDKHVRFWKSDGVAGLMLDHGKDVPVECHFSPDGNYLATLSESGITRLWDKQGRMVRQYLSTYYSRKTARGAFVWHPGSKGVVATDRVKRNRQGEPENVFLPVKGKIVPLSGSAVHTQWNADGTRLLAVGHGRSYFFNQSVWRYEQGKLIPLKMEPIVAQRIFPRLFSVGASWSPDGKRFAMTERYFGATLAFYTANGKRDAAPIESPATTALAISAYRLSCSGHQ